MVQRFAPGQQLNVGIVGATGLVGSMIREILAERNFPVGQLRLFASARSAGKVVDGVTVEDAATADFAGLDVVLFSAGGSTSKALAPKAAAAGAVRRRGTGRGAIRCEVPVGAQPVGRQAGIDSLHHAIVIRVIGGDLGTEPGDVEMRVGVAQRIECPAYQGDAPRHAPDSPPAARDATPSHARRVPTGLGCAPVLHRYQGERS